MKRLSKGLWITAILFLMGVISTPVFAQQMSVERIEGLNRYETAVELSKYTYKSSPIVIVATGENYPDALAGGTLAIQLDAPILLTQKNNVDPLLQEELKRLGTQRIYLLGGESAVSKEVENELGKIAKTIRIAGKNRYETANEIGNMRFELRKDQSILVPGDNYVFVSGTNFPDALCASPFVGQMMYGGNPSTYLLLTQRDHNVSGSTVIGGPSAFSFPVSGFTSEYGERIYGKNRYSTAVEVAKRYPKEIGKEIDTIILTNGLNYPDALSSAPLVASKQAALLLTNPKNLSLETKEYIRENKIKKVIVVGGNSAVSEKILQELKDIQ